MKFKWMIPQSIVISGITAVIGMNLLAPPTLAQPSSDGIPPTQAFPVLAELNLTSDQKSQLKQLAQTTRSQILAILTPDQQVKFGETLQQGEGIRAAAMSIDLSSEQQQKLRGVFQVTRSKFETILTPDQQQIVAQRFRSQQKL